MTEADRGVITEAEGVPNEPPVNDTEIEAARA
jgi:hypothetical protein